MELNYERLLAAVSTNDAAIRLTVRLQPAGGPGTKVFPPTHSGGVYAWEMRRMSKDEILPTVLLDSVQSQANRMEQALLEAHRSGSLTLPLLQVDFSKQFPDIGMITTLDAPHRIADAIFRDSLLGDEKFRVSNIGRAFEVANIRNATPLFQYCPHALIFGVWDSTGSAGGLGNKFQRVIVSEIIGINAEKGVHTGSRIDPLGIKKVEIYKTPDGDWTNDKSKAQKNKDGEPVKAKPSDFVHSNIPPDFSRYNPKQDKAPLRTMYEEIRVGDVLVRGVTIDYAIQTAVISLPALRRLRFPVNGEETDERNNAARTVLATLALAGILHQREKGYDLRSRCLLIPVGDTPFELIANNGNPTPFDLTAAQADKIFTQAVNEAQRVGFPWQAEAITLQPENKLIELVRRSRELAGSEEE